MDDFTKALKEARKISDMDEAKFAEVQRFYEENELTKNQRMCPKCKEVITSRHSNDFVQCKCGYLGIDGGLDYIDIHIFF